MHFNNLKCDFPTQAMLQYLEKLQQEDLDELIKKRETQKQLMEDVNKANEVRNRSSLYIGIGFVIDMIIYTNQ